MSSVKPFIYGGLASITAEFGTFPIDTTKTRLQVQGQVADEALRAVRYRGMLHALYVISREEGIAALYNGIAPAILRQASYGTMKIGLYHFFKKRISVTLQRGESLYTNIGAGILSGAIGSSLANPTDVLKVRMQVGSLKEYEARQGMIKSFSRIYHTEGLKGLYRGVVPTAQRAAVIAGVLLPSYDFFKQSLLDYGVMGDTVTTHFVAGFLAGILGTAASNPVDVVKSRMMNQAVLLTNTSAMTGHVYTGSINCFVMTLRTEGVTALYKGFIPSYLRIGPWNIIFFITYEQLKKLY